MKLRQDEPKVLFEAGTLRIVGVARDYHGIRISMTIEEAYKDALGTKSWREVETREPREWVHAGQTMFEDTRDNLLFLALEEIQHLKTQLAANNVAAKAVAP